MHHTSICMEIISYAPFTPNLRMDLAVGPTWIKEILIINFGDPYLNHDKSIRYEIETPSPYLTLHQYVGAGPIPPGVIFSYQEFSSPLYHAPPLCEKSTPLIACIEVALLKVDIF